MFNTQIKKIKYISILNYYPMNYNFISFISEKCLNVIIKSFMKIIKTLSITE